MIFPKESVCWGQREMEGGWTQVRRDSACPTKDWGPYTSYFFWVLSKVYKEGGAVFQWTF